MSIYVLDIFSLLLWAISIVHASNDIFETRRLSLERLKSIVNKVEMCFVRKCIRTRFVNENVSVSDLLTRM